MKNKPYLAFFDLDHTILSDSSGKLLTLQAIRNDILKKRNLVEGAILSLLYKAGIMEGDKILARMTHWLHDVPEKWLNSITEEMMHLVIKPAIRDHARREIDYHNKNNGHTVILSASMSFICNPVKEYLGMDDVICSTMEVADGKFTGLAVGPYCYGSEKLIRAREYCIQNDLTLNDAYFYTDSVTDLPMLQAVGTPVCVTPDRKLKSIARKNGWQINWW